MKYTIPTMLSAAFLMLSSSVFAQTVSSFDDNVLANPESDYATAQAPGDYEFTSGNIKFSGNLASWGGYTNFNFSNYTDTITPDYTNDKSAITGKGFDSSSNYGIAFVSTDYMGPDPTATIPVGIKLLNDAAQNPVLGCYITNATYTYRYIQTTYPNTNFYLHLIIKGYNNGVASQDSVVFTLADYATDIPEFVNEWEWVDLTDLGNVDSITFDLISNDAGDFGINTPTYFAVDNIITLGSVCPNVNNLSVNNITASSATINWENGSPLNYAFEYEIAIDNSATLAPVGTSEDVDTLSYSATNLQPATTYYAHIRTLCTDENMATWDTVSFTTEAATGLNNINEALQISLNPNPVKNILNINGIKNALVSITDLSGRVILNQTINNSIDVSSLAAGTYILTVQEAHSNIRKTAKFVKE